MADLALLRAGLAANLNTLPAGLTSTPTLTISPYVTSNPTPPFIWIRPDQQTIVHYHETMGTGGLMTWSLNICAYVGALTDIDSQKLLDQLLLTSGATSVKAAAESDLTLGGACHSLQVTEARNYVEFKRPDGATLTTAEWVVEILA